MAISVVFSICMEKQLIALLYYTYGIFIVLKSHTIANKRCDVKKALSRDEMKLAEQRGRDRAGRGDRSRGPERGAFIGGGGGGWGPTGGWGENSIIMLSVIHIVVAVCSPVYVL